MKVQEKERQQRLTALEQAYNGLPDDSDEEMLGLLENKNPLSGRSKDTGSTGSQTAKNELNNEAQKPSN